MPSHCDHCRAPLREEDIQPEQQSVSCTHCGALYGLTRWEIEELRKQRQDASGQRQEVLAENPKLPNPRWTYEREGDVLRLSWSWYHPGIWCLLILLLFVLATSVPAAAGWVKPTKGTSQDALAVTIVFLLVCGYPILLSFLNRTRIEASPGTGLKIRHCPLPWFLPRTLQTHEIRQLYGLRKKHKNKSRTHYTYELRVQRADGSTRLLVGAGLTPEEVLFLERTLESHLGIEDRPVPGDFKPEGSA